MLPRFATFAKVLLAVVFATLLMPTSAAFAADGGSTPSILADTASWALLAGVLTPLLTSLIQQPRWSPRARTVVAVVVSIAVGVMTLLASGAFKDGAQTILSTIALVVVASAAAHKNIWQPAGVTPAIEKATSPSEPKHASPNSE